MGFCMSISYDKRWSKREFAFGKPWKRMEK